MLCTILSQHNQSSLDLLASPGQNPISVDRDTRHQDTVNTSLNPMNTINQSSLQRTSINPKPSTHLHHYFLKKPEVNLPSARSLDSLPSCLVSDPEQKKKQTKHKKNCNWSRYLLELLFLLLLFII